jgi:hypothetical protein
MLCWFGSVKSGDWLPIVDEIRHYSDTEMVVYQDILETLL